MWAHDSCGRSQIRSGSSRNGRGAQGLPPAEEAKRLKEAGGNRARRADAAGVPGDGRSPPIQELPPCGMREWPGLRVGQAAPCQRSSRSRHRDSVGRPPSRLLVRATAERRRGGKRSAAGRRTPKCDEAVAPAPPQRMPPNPAGGAAEGPPDRVWEVGSAWNAESWISSSPWAVWRRSWRNLSRTSSCSPCNRT